MKFKLKYSYKYSQNKSRTVTRHFQSLNQLKQIVKLLSKNSKYSNFLFTTIE